MPTPGAYTQLLSWWPVSDPDGYPLGSPSPGTPMHVPDSSHPLRPTVALRFSRAIDPSAYASDQAWSPYFLLTSLTRPAAANVVSFTSIAWDAPTQTLTFTPGVDLTPGDTYLASLSGTLRDSSGRAIERAYAWTFDVDSEAAAESGPPPPTLLAPADRSLTASPTLTWSMDSAYASPAGSRLAFRVTVASDPSLTQIVWASTVDSLP